MKLLGYLWLQFFGVALVAAGLPPSFDGVDRAFICGGLMLALGANRLLTIEATNAQSATKPRRVTP